MSGQEFVYLVEMKPSEVKNKRILISPLNWGMGHVSRCVGLIYQLVNQGNNIVVACDENQKAVFQEYFPDLHYIHHEGYPFKFGGTGNFSWDIISRFSALSSRLREERRQVSAYVKEYKIDLVIADHRYGFRSRNAKSIFITHQFNLPLKWYEVLIAGRHRKLMFKFNEVWIMDTNKYEFAGKLSVSGDEKQVSYIGLYSRFSMYDLPEEKSGNTALIVSGPTVYGQKMFDDQMKELSSEKFITIASEDIITAEGYERAPSSWKAQDQIILNAKHIISRSGYSTIMDLDFLKTPSTLCPTRGQREQEYLYEYHDRNI